MSLQVQVKLNRKSNNSIKQTANKRSPGRLAKPTGESIMGPTPEALPDTQEGRQVSFHETIPHLG